MDVFRPKPRIFTLTVIISTLSLLGLWTVSDPTHLVEHGTLDAADLVAASVCHRIPTHGFMLFGRPLPLCARCSGIYTGIMLSITMICLSGRTRYAAFPQRTLSLILFAFIGLMGFDGFNSLAFDMGWYQLYTPHNTLRLLTGLAAGLAVGIFIQTVFAQTVWKDVVWQPVIGTMRELLSLLLLAALTSLLILSNQPTILFVLAIVSVVGVLTILGMLYAILFLVLIRREAFGTANWHVVPLYTVGLLIASVQIIAIATFRYNLTGSLVGF